jgi:hypothetical protein
MKKIIVLFIVCLASRIFAAENIIEDKVIIKGDSHSRVESEKIPIQQKFDIDRVLTFDMKPVQNIYTFESQELYDERYIKIPGYKPISPLSGVAVTDIITSPDIKIFQPEELKKAKSWRLTIVDSMGREVAVMTHVNYKANKSIVWNGRDSAGRMLKVGYPYSTIFEWSFKSVLIDGAGTITAWEDEGLEKHTEIGRPFTIDAIAYTDGNSAKIDVAFSVLYEQEEKVLRESMVGQIAVLVKKHFKKPVSVFMYADDAQYATDQSDNIKRAIAQKLVAPIDLFESRGYAITDRRARLEVTVGGTPKTAITNYE